MQPLLLKKNSGFYQIPLLEQLRLKAVITTREFNMAFQEDSALSDRCKAYRAIEMSWANIVCPSQVHGNGIFFATKAHRGRGRVDRKKAIASTDALITDCKGLPISVLTADCLPVFIFDAHTKTIALIHAGWRGIANGIIAKTITEMVRRRGLYPGGLLVILGPSIRPCCYEVGKDFLGYFNDRLTCRDHKIYFDLPGAALRQLVACGVHAGRIYDSSICTSCHNGEFFSYRREGAAAGRSMFAVEIL